jgi:NAD-dependent deacetylase
MTSEQIFRTARLLSESTHVVALTGAGISVESGIPPFRGKGGMWEKIDPMKYAHIDFFLNNPAEVWRVLIGEMKAVLENATPNDGHKGLARLESMGILKSVITQNIDGLHQKAGNTDVIEFHGNFAEYYCLACGQRTSVGELDLADPPPRCHCGGIFRPDCVFFGEGIPSDVLWRSQQAATRCDVMLVVGTSAVVQPAASMPVTAKAHGAKVIEINPERTPLTGYVSDDLILGPGGEVMTLILDAMESMA